MQTSEHWGLIHQATARGEHAQAAQLSKKLFRKTNDIKALVSCCESLRLLGDSESLLKELESIKLEEIRDTLGIHGIYLVAEKIKTLSIDESIPHENINWNEKPNASALGYLFEHHENDFPSFEGFEILRKATQIPNEADIVDAQVQILCTPPKVIFSDSRSPSRNRNEYYVDAFACGNVQYKNAQVEVGSNTVITGGTAYVDEYRNEFGNFASPYNDPVLVGYKPDQVMARISIGNLQSLQSGFWLAGAFVKEFGHFVSNHLVKFQYFKNHAMWGKWPLFIPNGLPTQLREFINFYVGTKIEVIELEEGIRYLADEIVVVPSRVFSPTNMRAKGNTRPKPHVCVDPIQFGRLKLELLDTVKNVVNKNSEKKIYLSRDGFTRRMLLNREDLEHRMREQKLTTVQMSELSATEQICYMRDSEMIVAEVASWFYLCQVAEGAKVIGLNSDYDHHYWSELSGVKNAMGAGSIALILGKRSGSKKVLSFENENSPHLPWTISSRALDVLDSQISLI